MKERKKFQGGGDRNEKNVKNENKNEEERRGV